MLRARLATAAVAIPLLLLLIFVCPPWWLAILVGIIAVLGLIEFALMAFPGRRREQAVLVGLGTILAVVAAAGPGLPLLAALSATYGGGLVWTYVGRRDFERALADLGVILVGVLYVAFLLPHFVWLRQAEHGSAWVTLVLATSMLGDSCGYFAGQAIGRHKLAPRLSPGKTVEGALAILAGSVTASLVVSSVLLSDVGWREGAAVGLILGVLAQLGDLAESVMKRTFGAKDSGRLFPGHGGVLDRIDSLLFPVSFVYYYVVVLR